MVNYDSEEREMELEEVKDFLGSAIKSQHWQKRITSCFGLFNLPLFKDIILSTIYEGKEQT